MKRRGLIAGSPAPPGETGRALPHSAALFAPAGRAAVTIGSDLSQSGTPIACVTGGDCTVAQTALHGRRVTSPIDGVLVRAGVGNSSTSGTVRLRVISRVDGSFVGRSSFDVPGRSCPGVCVAPTRLPICTGDQIGIDAPAGSTGGTRSTPGASLAVWSPFLADGQTRSPDAVGSNLELLFNADVEPDADRDGLGDESQDPDPSSASGTRPACPPRRLNLRLRLGYKVGHDRAGRRCAVNRGISARLTGGDTDELRKIAFRFGRRRPLIDRRPPFRRLVDRTRHRGRSHRHRVAARALAKDGRRLTLRRRVRVCAHEQVRLSHGARVWTGVGGLRTPKMRPLQVTPAPIGCSVRSSGQRGAQRTAGDAPQHGDQGQV